MEEKALEQLKNEIASIMKEGFLFNEAIQEHKKRSFERTKFFIEHDEDVKRVLKRLADK